MHLAVKIIVGVILLIGGVTWTYFYFNDFVSVFKGVVGLIVAIVGFFIVWVEMSELRIQREVEITEKKADKKEDKEVKENSYLKARALYVTQFFQSFNQTLIKAFFINYTTVNFTFFFKFFNFFD